MKLRVRSIVMDMEKRAQVGAVLDVLNSQTIAALSDPGLLTVVTCKHGMM